MCEVQARGIERPIPLERGQRDLKIEVGRGGRRSKDTGFGEIHAHRIPDEEHTGRGVLHRHVMPRVPRRVGDVQGTSAAEIQRVAVIDREESIRGDGLERPEQFVQTFTEHSIGARHELRRIDHVPRAFTVNDDRRVGELGDEITGAAGVVEMDVRTDEVLHVRRSDAVCCKRRC